MHSDGFEPQEREWSRWARELHDETLQGLGAVRVLLSTARRHHVDSDQLVAAVDQALEMLTEEIQKLRHLIVELRPAELDEIGLEAAIEKLRGRVGALGGPKVTTEVRLAYEMGESPTRLTPEVETAVYRIVQEALTNTVKHADASSVRVRVIDAGDELDVEISDDGRGFNGKPAQGGFGIVGMRERAMLISGRLTVVSSGKGTTVRLMAPATRSR
jgi:two-component system, NarL family, sensor histidine kinase DevS